VTEATAGLAPGVEEGVHREMVAPRGDWLKSDFLISNPSMRLRTPAIQIFRFANGKIVESWAARDDLGTLRQLGHLPPMTRQR
jgi:hypothetical protein